MKHLGLALVAMTVAAGCSSTSSDGGTDFRYFDEPFHVLWDAAHTALQRVEAEVVGENDRQGLITAVVEMGPPFGEADLAVAISRPRHSTVLQGWEVTISSRPPPGAKGGQNWPEVMADLEEEVMSELSRAVLTHSVSARRP